MNRLPRNIHESGFFHVMVQGIKKEYIFEKNLDKEYYLSLLTGYNSKFNLMLLAYCIMDNHAHLLLYTNQVEEMSNYMRIVNSRFAVSYNRTNDRVGYVFRDRFNSQYISNKDYLLRCLNYIHMNPVKAKMIEKPENYIYSSYNYYKNKSKIVTDDVIKKIFGQVENYSEIFFNIPNDDFEVMDIDRESKNFEIATKLYLKEKNIQIDVLKKDKANLIDFCKEIIIKKGYKQKKVAEFLRISQGTLSKIMRNIYLNN